MWFRFYWGRAESAPTPIYKTTKWPGSEVSNKWPLNTRDSSSTIIGLYYVGLSICSSYINICICLIYSPQPPLKTNLVYWYLYYPRQKLTKIRTCSQYYIRALLIKKIKCLANCVSGKNVPICGKTFVGAREHPQHISKAIPKRNNNGILSWIHYSVYHSHVLWLIEEVWCPWSYENRAAICEQHTSSFSLQSNFWLNLRLLFPSCFLLHFSVYFLQNTNKYDFF